MKRNPRIFFTLVLALALVSGACQLTGASGEIAQTPPPGETLTPLLLESVALPVADILG